MIRYLGILGLFVSLASCDTSGPRDTVFHGGTILSVDKEFSEHEALAIRGNIILAVGSLDKVIDATTGHPTMIDIDDSTVLPGFIDAHAHPIVSAVNDAALEYVGVNRFRTTDEVLAHLAQLAEETPVGDWVAARSYDPAVQFGPDALTFDELDAVSTEHPVFVWNASGHIAYANTLAFEKAGIADDIENPDNAEYVRDESGHLNGTIKGSAAVLPFSKNVPGLDDADGAEALTGMTNRFAANGITTYGDLATGAYTGGPDDLILMRKAADSGRLTARMRAYAIIFADYGVAWEKSSYRPGFGDELIRLVGIKLAADGSNQGRTGLQREPYYETTTRGIEYTSTEELTRLAIKYGSRGFQLAIHGNGDKAIDNILDALEASQESGIDLFANRPRIEHCSILHDDQIERMKALGVSGSFLIGHVNYWGLDFHEHIFGPEKAQLLDRAASLENAGVPFSIHSDWTVTEPDIMQMIETAVTRTTWKDPDFVLAPQERISVETAIRAVTSAAAWQLHSEHEIGSLEPGKLADFVILEKDPRTVEPSAISDIRILETWFDGKPSYRSGNGALTDTIQ